MSAKPTGLDPEEDEILETGHNTNNAPSSHYSHSSPVTHLGIYGSYRLLPGITTLTCKCAEKDTEILELKAKHEETITALSKGHADIISHLTTDFRDKFAIQTKEYEEHQINLATLVQIELEDRLGAAFHLLDTSWAKQKNSIEHEHNSLILALRTENDKDRRALEFGRVSLEKREKAVIAREQDVKTSKKTLSKNVQKRRAELENSRKRLTKFQSVLSLVSEYQFDCMLLTQQQASQYYEDAQEQAQVAMNLAQQEAQSIVEAARTRGEEILAQAQAIAESITAEAQRHSEALYLEGERRSPTLSDISTSAYSLRSFESLPILEEGPGEETNPDGSSGTPNNLSRRASFDGTKRKRSSATKRKPIPFSNGLPSEFGLEMGNAVNTPGISRGQRKRTVSSPLRLDENSKRSSPYRRREADLLERSKAWRPY